MDSLDERLEPYGAELSDEDLNLLKDSIYADWTFNFAVKCYNLSSSPVTKAGTIGKSGVKPIRLHDLRHSYASLLIELGFTPLLVSERLGHEKIQTTLNTYSPLSPNKDNMIANKLNYLY